VPKSTCPLCTSICPLWKSWERTIMLCNVPAGTYQPVLGGWVG
jgi:hypothetical protein